jgi:hypothetical protein
MGYYQGDYGWRGSRMRGMPRGDPGFFSFLGNAAKSLLGFVPGVGPIASKVLSGVSRALPIGEQVVKSAGRAIIKHPVISGAAAAGGIGAVGLGAHLIHGHKLSTLARTGVRKRPRMNPCNPRALRRAIRRTHSFAKLAMKTIHLVHPKKKARFGGFKKKKKS